MDTELDTVVVAPVKAKREPTEWAKFFAQFAKENKGTIEHKAMMAAASVAYKASKAAPPADV